ncbi:hypothetical protein Hanom_Chr16g01507351 [Helianthus anomalus]
MYKSFNHQETSLSAYALSPKLNMWMHKLGFLPSLIWSAAHPLLSLSMAISH